MAIKVNIHQTSVPHTTDGLGAIFPNAFTGIGKNRHIQSISSTYSNTKTVTWDAGVGPNSITVLAVVRSGTITLGTNTPALLKFVVDASTDNQAQNHLIDVTGSNVDVEYYPVFLPVTTATPGSAQGLLMSTLTLDFVNPLRRLDFLVSGGASLVVDAFVFGQ